MISVVIPVFNPDLAQLRTCLESVLSQSMNVDEIVVIDDGSSIDISEWISTNFVDTTATFFKHIRNDHNLGIAKSLTKGVESASGAIIFRIDCDDFWHSDHVALIVNEFKLKPHAAIIHSRASAKYGPLITTYKRSLMTSIFGLYWDNPIIHSAVAFRKLAYKESIGYDNGFRWEDFALWSDIKMKAHIIELKNLTVVYNVSDQSLSRVSSFISKKERLSILRRNNTKLWEEKHVFRFLLQTALILLLSMNIILEKG